MLLLMMELFQYPNGIDNWSSSISVTAVVLDGTPYYELTNPAAFGRGMGIVSTISTMTDVAYFFKEAIGNGWKFHQSSTGLLEVDSRRKSELWHREDAVWIMRNDNVTIADPRSTVPAIRDATLMDEGTILNTNYRTLGLQARTSASPTLKTVYDVRQVNERGRVVKFLGTKNTVMGINNSVYDAFSGASNAKADACRAARMQLNASHPGRTSSPVECVVGGGNCGKIRRYTIVAKYQRA